MKAMQQACIQTTARSCSGSICKHQLATYCFVACRELGSDRNQLAALELSLTVQQPQQLPQQSQLMCHSGQCSSFGPVKSTVALLSEHVQMAKHLSFNMNYGKTDPLLGYERPAFICSRCSSTVMTLLFTCLPLLHPFIKLALQLPVTRRLCFVGFHPVCKHATAAEPHHAHTLMGA